MKKNIAIVWGGYSSEKEVSERSAEGIYSFIDKEKYNVYKVKIDRRSWEAACEGETYPIDKNDFSFSFHDQTVKFDFAYITIHGTPGEDGVLQGYFDMLCIPYSNCGVLASALTFSKYTCNRYLMSFGVEVADSLILRRDTDYSDGAIVGQLGLPVFVKPNVGGSSFATTKVKEAAQLQSAIQKAFDEAPEVIVERFVSGKEVTCGCFKTAAGFHVLPLTEVVTENEFFDYNAKYKGEVQEITPARISDAMTKKIQELTSNIYDWVGAKGIIRADFIISDENPVLLEVNTTPGMTVTSFIPQQVKAAGLSMTDVLSGIIEFESF
ncbi:MAG: D-alanine--D-alanine ligase [Dysgonamonadaceae bacterium]|jgi:D-alanine-D-alanine ligase|nr:D-alanine--D-alanine ligase [Dysgonamonadaceae bacterium]